MPGIPISSIVNAIAPLMIPSGGGSSTGPGGVQQVPPNQWNPRFDAEQPPAQIPDASALYDYVLDQDVNNSRNNALFEQQISNNAEINGQINQIMERNKTTLGLGGPNNFYDINLIRPASGKAGFKEDEKEPDGFRLYLICPPNPSGAVQLAANMIGTAAVGATEAIAKVAETAGEAAGSEIVTTIAATGGQLAAGDSGGQAAAQAAQDAAKKLKDGGEKARQLGQSIAKYMDEAKQNFDDQFNKYVKNTYENSQGNAFYSVILPMPKELTDTHQHNVDNLMMGFLPRAAAGLGIGLNNFSNSIASKYKDSYAKRSTGVSEGGIGELVNAATLGLSSVAAEAGAYAFDNLRARMGVGLNPNVETIYSAPTPRTFMFTFELYIKSKDESRLVKEFINKIKQHSYPFSVLGGSTIGQNQLYLYPGEVYFEFSGRFRNNLFRSLRPCIITNIQVQYSNQDQYQHFEDGNPIVYVISITLLENKLLDRNILVDDVEQYKNDTFADKDFRNNITFRDTFLGDKFRNAGENPQQVINNIGEFLGVGDLVRPRLDEGSPTFVGPPSPPNTPAQSQPNG